MRSRRPLSDGVSTFWHRWQWVSWEIFKNFNHLFHWFIFIFFSVPWVLTNFAKLFKKPASTKISHFPLSLRILSNYTLEKTKVESSLMQNFHNSYMTSTTSMLRFVYFDLSIYKRSERIERILSVNKLSLFFQKSFFSWVSLYLNPLFIGLPKV